MRSDNSKCETGAEVYYKTEYYYLRYYSELSLKNNKVYLYCKLINLLVTQ